MKNVIVATTTGRELKGELIKTKDFNGELIGFVELNKEAKTGAWFSMDKIKEPYEFLTDEVLKEADKIVFSKDITVTGVDDVNYITIEGTDKAIIITVYNDSLVLETNKNGDLDEDGNPAYRNRQERKTAKGILKYIEKHY